MADDTTDQTPQSAIPPRAVPPQVRSAADAESTEDSPTVRRQPVSPGGTPAPIPRTVRLKPIGAGAVAGVPATVSPLLVPSVGSTAPVDTEAAADAVKRMTARIMMMSNEGDPQTGKRRTEAIPSGGAKQATTSFESAGASDNSVMFKKQTLQIQMATTAPIPDMVDMPRTIKIRPSGGAQPITGTQPMSQLETHQVVGKAKTSRIPLDSAMSVPQSGSASTTESSDGVPKTIKLKRPGEMSTIRVSVPGTAAAAHTAGAQVADNASITQKKTIRVKRPMTPAAASVAGGGAADEPGVSGRTAMPPAALAAAAPERGTGWFITLAVACILVAIGVTGIMFVQLYGAPPNTKLDVQFQQG